MFTFSEIVLTAAIWILTLCGLFFGSRAALRKRRKKAGKPPQDR